MNDNSNQEDALPSNEPASHNFDRYRLGGRIYSEREFFTSWRNPTPLPLYKLHIPTRQLHAIRPEILADAILELRLEEGDLPLADFPLIEDFEVGLWGTIFTRPLEEHRLHYKLCFFSPTHGFLVNMSVLSPSVCKIAQPDFHIPTGEYMLPYFDMDESWVLLIVEVEQYVYILEGHGYYVFSQPPGYQTWFKVEKERYYSQWQQTIELCRQKCAEWEQLS